MVVALCRHAWPAGEGHAFDHVGIEGALREEVGAADLFRFFLEHIDEFAADELALRLGIGDAGKARHEAVLGIDHHQRDMIMFAEQRSEEHTSELKSLMRISFAVFCLKKKTTTNI